MMCADSCGRAAQGVVQVSGPPAPSARSSRGCSALGVGRLAPRVNVGAGAWPGWGCGAGTWSCGARRARAPSARSSRGCSAIGLGRMAPRMSAGAEAWPGGCGASTWSCGREGPVQRSACVAGARRPRRRPALSASGPFPRVLSALLDGRYSAAVAARRPGCRQRGPHSAPVGYQLAAASRRRSAAAVVSSSTTAWGSTGRTKRPRVHGAQECCWKEELRAPVTCARARWSGGESRMVRAF